MAMTEKMLNEVEAALGRSVPATLRQFVRTCPPAEFRRHFNFYSRARDMIRYNRSKTAWPTDHGVREPDGAGGFLPERPWPPEWIAVHDADSEWCTFVRPDDPGVWEWFHDHREIRRVAESLEALLARSLAEKGPAPPVETSVHPTLGELTWNPEYGSWLLRRPTPDGATVQVSIRPGAGDRDAFLALAAELIPRAVTNEPAVFAAAMSDGWADYLEYRGNDPDVPADLTAESVRGYLSWDWLSITAKAGEPTAVVYQYEADERIGMDLLLITTDADLRFREHVWLL